MTAQIIPFRPRASVPRATTSAQVQIIITAPVSPFFIGMAMGMAAGMMLGAMLAAYTNAFHTNQ